MIDFEFDFKAAYNEAKEESRLKRLEEARQHPRYEEIMAGIDNACNEYEDILRALRDEENALNALDEMEIANDIFALLESLGLRTTDHPRYKELRDNRYNRQKEDNLDRAMNKYV